MTRPIGSESEFRRLRDLAARAAGRGPGSKAVQRPPDQGKPAPPADRDANVESTSRARPADPRPKAPAPAASRPAPQPRQPAKAIVPAPTTGDNDHLDELLFGGR